MREVCFIIAGEQILRIYFGSQTVIPDSRDRWNVLWNHREEITEIAHTHPGGFLGFSQTDETTMEAVEAGTGRSFAWSIVTRAGYLVRDDGKEINPTQDAWWLEPLRELSFGSGLESRAVPCRTAAV